MAAVTQAWTHGFNGEVLFRWFVWLCPQTLPTNLILGQLWPMAKRAKKATKPLKDLNCQRGSGNWPYVRPVSYLTEGLGDALHTLLGHDTEFEACSVSACSELRVMLKMLKKDRDDETPLH